jgi:hypothetical protein
MNIAKLPKMSPVNINEESIPVKQSFKWTWKWWLLFITGIMVIRMIIMAVGVIYGW